MRYHWATTFLQLSHPISKRRNFTPVNPYKHSNFSAVKPVFFYNAEIKKDSQNKLLQNITGIWSDLNNYIYQKHCRCPNLRTLRQKRSRLHTVQCTMYIQQLKTSWPRSRGQTLPPPEKEMGAGWGGALLTILLGRENQRKLGGPSSPRGHPFRTIILDYSC